MTSGKLIIAFIAVLAVGVVGFGLIDGEAGTSETEFRSAAIDRGNVLKSRFGLGSTQPRGNGRGGFRDLRPNLRVEG